MHLLFLLMITCFTGCAQESLWESIQPKVTVSKVYGDGSTYCAFTSIVKRGDSYYVAFREGKTHAYDGDYGIIKILKSSDGTTWERFYDISAETIDLRDPDLSVKPDGKLQLHCGARILTDEGVYITKTYYADEDSDGFTNPEPVIMPKDITWDATSWIWRLTWHNNVGYGVSYGSDKLVLLKTRDGRQFETIGSLSISGQPTECRIRFKDDGTAIMLVRRDQAGMNKGYMGKSMPPYKVWEWKELNIYIAGEDFLIDGDRIILATRMTQNIGSWTAVWFGDNAGNFNWCYTLPFGCTKIAGDTAYAGMLNEDDEILISYHAVSNGDKPSIFLARIPKAIISF